MKKVYLFLATVVAALSSCMQEGALVPVEQENKVTIKAVAGDTKTLLDGTSVVWEQEDQLAVLLKGEETTIVNFAVEGEVDGANATFTGSVDPELKYTSAYAVYPHSAYTVDGGAGKISHTLPETQTGVITSGMNLSSALLNVEQLQAGEAVGTFQNALTLLQVVVPAGVQSVSLHSSDDALVGTLTFNEPNVDGVLTRAENGTKRTVTLSTGSELAEGTHSLLVYPGIAHTLTLTMVGTDGAEYTSAVSEIRFNAGEYRTIDLTEIFNVATDEVRVVLPAGGTVEVPVVTTGADYQVSLSSGAESWLTYELPTKSFHKETIVFNVAENTSGADRTATVTITCGEKSKTFRIQQKNIFMDFLNDENGDPIQWAETFGLYADAELNTQLTTFTNVFTIALSDDFSKGTYKISNMFKVDSYWNNGQQVTNKGGEYYANYDAENGELTVLKENSASGYTFTGNVVLAYDAVNKTFSAERIQATLLYGSSYYNNGATRYLGNYAAAVKVEEPTTEPSGVASLYGEYVESVQLGWSGDPETLVISESDNPSYDLKMLFAYTKNAGSGTYDIGYGKVNPEGTAITVTIPGSSNFYGPVNDFVLTVSDGVISGKYAGQKDYTATKKAAFNPASLYGEYVESVQLGWSGDPETLVISESDNPSYDLKMLFAYTKNAGSGTYDIGYGKVNPEGTAITVTIPGSSNFYGPVNDFVLTVSDGVISGKYAGQKDYTATKKAAFNPASLYGEYVESVQLGWSGDPETLVISESDNPSYDLKMLFAYTKNAGSGTYDIGYGKVNPEGTAITVTIPGSSNFYGPVNDFVLTVSDGVISGKYAGQKDYTATKQ